mmetsp:Transcript_589/g.917  ORF Transcript_589/g.917 Transcript_589/m.917 type:complete len:178 (+) Transcript_589:325-858(+)
MPDKFSAVEDLIIWRAFLDASKAETPWAPITVPTSTKFRILFYLYYCQGIEDENNLDIYSNLSSKPFEPRTISCIISRYNDKISPEVLRFMAVAKVTLTLGDKPDKFFFERCRQRFHTKHGRSFIYRLRNQDSGLILSWRDNLLLDDPEMILLEISDILSVVSHGFKESARTMMSCF